MPSMDLRAYAPVSTIVTAYHGLRAQWAQGLIGPLAPEIVWEGLLATRSSTLDDLRAKVELLTELLVDDLAPEAGAQRLVQSLQADLSQGEHISLDELTFLCGIPAARAGESTIETR